MDSDPLGHALTLAATAGILGVFALALAERLLPFLPSHGLLAGIGVAVSEGLWCLPYALIASVAGGTLGSFAGFRIGAGLKANLPPLLKAASRPKLVMTWLDQARGHGTRFAFLAQLVPAVRLLGPGISGAAGLGAAGFVLASSAGILVWNATFIGVGYAAGRLGGEANATRLGLATMLLMAAILIGVTLARQLVKRRARPV